jgi:hypothetical protein
MVPQVRLAPIESDSVCWGGAPPNTDCEPDVAAVLVPVRKVMLEDDEVGVATL